MRKLVEIALGVLTAIGGFVDIGDLVASTETGARFGLGLAWVLLVGVVGIIIYAEMAGRVASVSGRAVFDLVRERLGAGAGLLNLAASFFITLLTLAAEIGGVALSLQLATSVNYLLFVPVVGFLVWLVCWRVRFELMDNAVGLLGSAMTPYEVFFFSSGAVEQRWTRSDLLVNRLNVYLGFPLGGLLALALMAAAALVLEPRGIDPSHLSQAALPNSLVLGRLGLALAQLGFFACTFGAALETALSCGTASPSTSAGSGASWSSRPRRLASSWSCWSRSRSAWGWC